MECLYVRLELIMFNLIIDIIIDIMFGLSLSYPFNPPEILVDPSRNPVPLCNENYLEGETVELPHYGTSDISIEMSDWISETPKLASGNWKVSSGVTAESFRSSNSLLFHITHIAGQSTSSLTLCNVEYNYGYLLTGRKFTVFITKPSSVEAFSPAQLVLERYPSDLTVPLHEGNNLIDLTSVPIYIKIEWNPNISIQIEPSFFGLDSFESDIDTDFYVGFPAVLSTGWGFGDYLIPRFDSWDVDPNAIVTSTKDVLRGHTEPGNMNSVVASIEVELGHSFSDFCIFPDVPVCFNSSSPIEISAYFAHKGVSISYPFDNEIPTDAVSHIVPGFVGVPVAEPVATTPEEYPKLLIDIVVPPDTDYEVEILPYEYEYFHPNLRGPEFEPIDFQIRTALFVGYNQSNSDHNLLSKQSSGDTFYDGSLSLGGDIYWSSTERCYINGVCCYQNSQEPPYKKNDVLAVNFLKDSVEPRWTAFHTSGFGVNKLIIFSEFLTPWQIQLASKYYCASLVSERISGPTRI